MEQAGKLAQRKSGCLDEKRLTMNPLLLKGDLSAALLLEKYKARQMPDYKSVPWQFANAKIAAGDPKTVRLIVGLVFAECIFRNRADEVRKLLDEKPYTKLEKQAWEGVSPVFEECLPVNEGQQVGFGKMELRSYLGQAGYLVDAAYSNSAVPQAEVKN